MTTSASGEIKALARILDELDYYQLLEIPSDATASTVKLAFHTLSRRFHPDVHRGIEPEIRRELGRIAKRVTEAYSVLRDPRRRRVYDERLRAASGGPVRLQLAEAEAQAGKKALEERMGRTPKGRQFFAKAHADIDRGDLAAAARNLLMALTFEPGNDFFKQKLADVRKLL